MGSFHLTCAVTNTPITHYDRAVMLGLDTANSEVSIWPRGAQITSLPIRGVYNSYGAIDIDEGQDDRVAMFLENTPLICDPDRYQKYNDDDKINTNSHAFMLIHERVYDYLLTDPCGEDWGKKRHEQMLAELNTIQEQMAKNPGDFFASFKFDQLWRETFMIRGESLGFEHQCWNKYIGDMKIGATYYREVGAVLRNTFAFGYRIAPSMYASESLSILDRDGLTAIVKEIRDEYAREYADEDETSPVS